MNKKRWDKWWERDSPLSINSKLGAIAEYLKAMSLGGLRKETPLSFLGSGRHKGGRYRRTPLFGDVSKTFEGTTEAHLH